MEVLEFGNKASKIVLIQPVDVGDLESAEHECSLIAKKTGVDLLLRVFGVENWNRDLSPWKAPAVFGNEGFGDGAEETLTEILKTCKDRSKRYYIGGYSLAGLFALWSAYRTEIFCGVAAASPSVWFPGFAEYMKQNEIKCECIYLSLGDKEAKTRNPVMSTVAEKIREAYALLKARNRRCILEWNEGNHFKDVEIRTANAFSWLLYDGLL